MVELSRVLVVGGGIGGLTLVSALRGLADEVELVEQADAWHTVGAGLSIQPNGMRVLRRLGSDAGVLERGCEVQRWLFADERGHPLCEIGLPSVWGEVGPFVGIGRAELQTALVDMAGGVPCRFGTTIAALVDTGAAVTVEFTDGTTSTYDLVVGADGIHSTVRALTFGAVQLTFAGQIAWRSVSPITLPGKPSVQFWLGDRCFFGLCSIGNRQTYGFAYIASSDRHDPIVGRLARLRDHFAHFGPTVQHYLAHVERDEQVHCSTIAWIDQEPWYRGRIVLIGDAAHASSPMMGQGANLAMEDAWVLAAALRAEPTIEAALASYVERRLPRVRWVQQQSLAVADAFNAPPEIRNAALREKGAEMFHARYQPLKSEP